jgi:hypothetical protein
MTLVKLTEEDKKFLREMMYEDEKSINQIEKALDKTIFELDGKRITAEEARKILGDEDFLSGLDRSSFHVDAVRYTEERKAVTFDSRPFFREKARRREAR